MRLRRSIGRLVHRLDRVLELAERLMAERLGGDADADLLARYHAFRWDVSRGPGTLVPIESPLGFDLDDLLGVDRAKERLVRNTEQFVSGHPCNHVLLFGERGTGKSSAVRGLLHRFAPRGLRVVEIQKAELSHLPQVLGALRSGGKEYRFLLFCDDLSFGPNEPGFRELKAALEGSLEAPPENVCVVATSNRRHLLPETMADNRAAQLDEGGELRLGEVLEEKLALADRFGLVLGFYGFDQLTYLEIVEQYARAAGVPTEGMEEAALRWALDHSSRSGRTARQFVDDWVGARAVDTARGIEVPRGESSSS